MLFQTSLQCLAITLISSSAITDAFVIPAFTTTPTPSVIGKETLQCPDKGLNEPWIISNIDYVQRVNKSGAVDTISFHFCDLNKGLRLDTECNATVTDGSAQSEGGGYVECRNSSVAFQFAGGNLLLLERSYEDDCLGPPPYNYGSLFGQNNTDFTVTKTNGGSKSTQTEMLIPITSQD